MAVLKSNGKLDKEHIDLLVLITIMEDIGQVIMLSILTPILAGSSMGTQELVVMIVSIVAFMVASLFIGLRLIPRLVNWISDNVALEVLVIFSVGLAFGMAFLSVQVGLSMAIGAFLMGMMMSACKKGKEINHQIEPMKNMFMAMFFISVGMEISLNMLIDNISLIIIFYLLFAVLKISTVFLGYWVCNEEGRRAFVSAVGLTAMGEFAFIIAKEAFDYNVVGDEFYTAVIGAALASMIVLPILTRYSDKIWDKASEKCPTILRNQIDNINNGRNDLYSKFHDFSKKSQRNFRKGMTKTYITVLMILIIELVFIYGFEPAGQWLSQAFGYDVKFWYIGILAINFLVLFVPTMYMVVSIKKLDALIVDSARHMSRYGKQEESGRIFQDFLQINAYLLTISIVFIIIMIVPNPLGLLEHFLILLIAIVALAVAIMKMRKKNQELDEEPKYTEEEPVEEMEEKEE